MENILFQIILASKLFLQKADIDSDSKAVHEM